jgi:hypothetical protein
MLRTLVAPVIEKTSKASSKVNFQITHDWFLPLLLPSRFVTLILTIKSFYQMEIDIHSLIDGMLQGDWGLSMLPIIPGSPQ